MASRFPICKMGTKCMLKHRSLINFPCSLQKHRLPMPFQCSLSRDTVSEAEEALPCPLCPLFPGEVSHPNISGHSCPEILPLLGTNCQGHTGINSVLPPASCPLPLRFWGRNTALKMGCCPAYVGGQNQGGCPRQSHRPRNSQALHLPCQPQICHPSTQQDYVH